jgi:cystathionine beta-lyase/cystathionine gamma-synthase
LFAGEPRVRHCGSGTDATRHLPHAAIPAPVKRELDIRETLVRISVGIEDPEDLWEDLNEGLS